MQKQKFKLPDSAQNRRGFLLLVVVGILAVLLTICVGFLSYSRGEVQAVASQRDKSDGLDIVHSAIDWTIANIGKDHLDSSANFDTGKPVTFSNDNATWWYRPSEPGLTAFLTNLWPNNSYGGCPPSVSTNTETQYTYLPSDFFPGGGVRGRFTVQVLDTNALINLNDWNDDCMPTQAQMAHMMMDAYGEYRGEIWRKWRDVQSTNGWWNVNMYACPLRYHEAWRVATHTQRFLGWQLWDPGVKNDNILSYNWVTGNTSWFTLYGPDYSSLHSNLQSDGVAQAWAPRVPNMSYRNSWNFYPPDPPNGSSVWTQNNDSGGLTWIGGWIGNYSIGLQPWYMSGFTCQAGVDPNTGRSPINVNTCFNSGEVLPNMPDQKHPTYTMEGVWNVESLRHLIKVGWFRSPTDGNFKHAQKDWATLDRNEKMHIEQLKVKLAYQYQETLCRYFTGTYAHACNYRVWDPIYWQDAGTYPTAFPNAPAPTPTHYCPITDYSKPRFPVSLQTFRNNCRDDFIKMCTSPQNTTKYNASAVPSTPPGYFGPDHTDGTVSFDDKDTPEIALGKLDTRVAAACYDNLYPGKPDLSGFNGCKANDVTSYPDNDPIYELYLLQLGRQEDIDDKYQIDPAYVPVGSGGLNNPAYTMDGGTSGQNMQNQYSTTNFYTATADNNAVPIPPLWNMPNSVFMPSDRFLWDGWPWGWSTWWYNTPKQLNQWEGGGNLGQHNGNNIYGYWADNPALPEISSYIFGETFPEGNKNHRIDMKDHYGNRMNVCAKGRDVYTNSGGVVPAQAVPTGPWIDNDFNSTDGGTVPWRQRCFTPDSFSTELTTTSNCYLLVINAELVDAASVAANPNNPAAQRRIWWNQWGVIVELTPGMEPQITGSAAVNNPEINYYLNERPMLRKSASADKTFNNTPYAPNTAFYDPINAQDAKCPSLVSRIMDYGASQGGPSYDRVQNQIGMNSNDDQTTVPTSGSIDPEHNNSTTVMQWGTDIHGVPPATSGNFVTRNAVPNNGRAADVIYKGTSASQKRVLIRSIWCLNDAVRR